MTRLRLTEEEDAQRTRQRSAQRRRQRLQQHIEEEQNREAMIVQDQRQRRRARNVRYRQSIAVSPHTTVTRGSRTGRQTVTPNALPHNHLGPQPQNPADTIVQVTNGDRSTNRHRPRVATVTPRGRNDTPVVRLRPASLRDTLEQIGRGEEPVGGRQTDTAIANFPEMAEASRKFHEDIYGATTDLFHCPRCKERGPYTSRANNGRNECSTCEKTSGKFSHENEMDPFPTGDIEIDFHSLNNLPVDGNIQNEVRSVTEDDTDSPRNEPEVAEEEIDNGPDQCLATGQPESEIPVIAEYLPRPLTDVEVNVEEMIRQHFNLEQPGHEPRRRPRVDWPTFGQGLSDYATPNLQAAAFPTLFPFGLGDATKHDRRVAVSLTEATKHLLWYAVVKADGSFFYPFVNHPRWMYWAQNTCERHRINGQRRIYISRSPDHTELTMDELRHIATNRDDARLRDILGRMAMFSSNINGSDANMYSKQKELEALMEQKGMSTIWWSFSAADNHWDDFHRSLNSAAFADGIDEAERAKMKRKFVRENPHLVDAFFFLRVQAFMKHFFGKRCLDATYVWYRVEFQQRGTAHIHGCCRLESDPGLVKLAEKVLIGKLSQRILQANDIRLPQTHFSEEQCEMDQWEDDVPEFHPERLQQLEDAIQTGVEAHDKIVLYNDALTSTIHPDPLPIDAHLDQREEQHSRFQQTANNVHPCATDFHDEQVLQNPTEHLSSVLDACERHLHNGYCQRKKVDKNGRLVDACRFGYPHPLRDSTIVAVQQSCNRAKRITTRMELLSKRNDRWLNSYSSAFTKSWQANIDIRLTIDAGKIVQYMTKYVTKTEKKQTWRTQQFLFATLDRVSDEGGDTINVLRRLMRMVHGERMRSQQETTHLINSLPLVKCTHKFRKVNLNNDSAEVEESGNEIMTVVDAYAKRLLSDLYISFDLYNQAELRTMSLKSFASKFTVAKQGRHRNKIKELPNNTIIQYSPNIQVRRRDEDRKKYAKYARLMLVKNKPWVDSSDSAYGGETISDEDAIRMWEAFLQQNDVDEIQETVQPLLERLQEEDDAAELGLETGAGDGAGDDVDDRGLTDLDFNCNLDPDDDDDPEEEDITWDEDFDWSQTVHDYTGENAPVPAEPLLLNLQECDSGNSNEQEAGDTSEFDRVNLNEQQRKFCDIVTQVLEYNDGMSSTDGGEGLGRCLILRGGGGTGKSFAVWSTIEHALQRDSASYAIMTPTGKAATVFEGACTVFNTTQGLALPVGRQKFRPLNGRQLRSLQDRFHGKLQVLFLDEFTMLTQKHLHYIEKRLQQVMACPRLFGGVVVVLIGDTGQLPPVLAPPMWCTKIQGKNEDALAGKSIYFQEFKSIVVLHENNRLDHDDPQAVEFSAFLLRLRDGKCTEEDWLFLRNNCSKESMTPMEWARKGFTDHENLTYLYPTNKQVNLKNKEKLMQTGKPILQVAAEHSSAKAQALSPERFRGLRRRAYFSVESRVTLTYNLAPSLGLANGTCGKVRDFIFDNGHQYSTLPSYVWVDFGSCYRGPTFFPGNDQRRGWVPIAPIESEYDSPNSDGGYTRHTRRMLPLRLAWAWTIWKVQGQTIKTKIVVDLGKKESEHGLTYVALSRVRRFSDIGIEGGITCDRITTSISNLRKLKERLLEDARLDRLST